MTIGRTYYAAYAGAAAFSAAFAIWGIWQFQKRRGAERKRCESILRSRNRVKASQVYEPPKTSDGSRRKRVLFLRHGESEYNTSDAKIFTEDPPLTAAGEEQAAAVRAQLQSLARTTGLKVDAVVTSPMQRAIRTAQIVNEGLDAPLVVTPLHSERVCEACDVGSCTSKLQARYPALDFSECKGEEWWAKKEMVAYLEGNYDHHLAAIQQRARLFSSWIENRPEHTLLVVGHGSFFAAVLGQRIDRCRLYDCQWPPPFFPPLTTTSRYMQRDALSQTGRPALISPGQMDQFALQAEDRTPRNRSPWGPGGSFLSGLGF
jgi:broad specificity phosphatase PhoE